MQIKGEGNQLRLLSSLDKKRSETAKVWIYGILEGTFLGEGRLLEGALIRVNTVIEACLTPSTDPASRLYDNYRTDNCLGWE